MSRIILILLPACLFLVACRHPKPVHEKAELAWYERTFMPAFQQGNADSAIYIYDSIAHSLKNPPRIISFIRYDFMHGLTSFQWKDNGKASIYLDSAIAYLEHNRLTAQYPVIYFGFLCRKGDLALFLANYNQAYEYYLKAKQWASAHLTSCEIADYSYDMGMILYRQQKYAESGNYFKESFGQYAACSRPVGDIAYKQQEITGNIGLCYVKTKQYDSALVCFNRALAIIQQNRDSILPYKREMAQAVAWGNMAKVYVARNQPDTALDLFTKSLAVNTRMGYDRADAQLVQAQLAEVYEKQKRYADMRTALRQLKTGLDTLANIPALLSWNRLMAAYYRHTGQRLKEFDHYQAFISLRDSISEAESGAFQTDIARQIKGKEQELEIGLLKKNNQLNKTYLIITISLSVIAVLVIVFFYIIFRKTARLNRLISAQKEELEQLNNVKNRLFSIVSHDLRAPVHSLSSFIDLLDDGDLSKESLIEYSQLLKKSMAYTSGMMENLLNWAASQLQGFRPSVQRSGIKEVAEKAVTNTTSLAGEKKINLINTIPWNTVAGIDPDMLQVVVRNLLTNAIKYSYPGGTVTIGTVPAGENAVAITITDNGVGMPEDYVGKINSGDLQMLRTTSGTANEKGTGLGIHLCRIFVDMMNGKLQVESEKGKGTVFTVVLPV